jgi:hypothetical protein
MHIDHREQSLRDIVQRGLRRPMPALDVPRRAARHDGEPGGQTRSGGIVGLQQPEIVLAEPDEDFLQHILGLGTLAHEVAHCGEDEARIPPDEPVPGPLIACGQRGEINVVRHPLSPESSLGTGVGDHPAALWLERS